MRHYEGTHIAAGGTLLGIGCGSILTLLIAAAATAAQPPLAERSWYLSAVAVSVLFVAMGAWLVLGVYVPWIPLPPTAHARQMAPDLKIDRVSILNAGRTMRGDIRIMFHVGFQNYGRGDVPNTIIEVLVPDFFLDFRCCDMFGNERLVGRLSQTAESLQKSDQGEEIASRVWSRAGFTFYGNTATPIYFLLFQSDPQPFRVRVSATSSELAEAVGGIYDLDPRVESDSD
jgi:hypothetical protein